MTLSELRTHLLDQLGKERVNEITSIYKNQLFGYADKSEGVAFAAIEYCIEMHSRGIPTQTVAPALIFDSFRETDVVVGPADRYDERKELCLNLHDLIRSAGYTLTSCVHHSHSEGDDVRCDYYKHDHNGYTGSSLRVIYTPTDWMPGSAILIKDKHLHNLADVYYTVGYEDGQLVAMTANELDGRPIRSINIDLLEEKTWQGTAMHAHVQDEVRGLGVKYVLSRTMSEAVDGWNRTYTAELDSKERVQIVVKNYHTTDGQFQGSQQ